MARDLGDFQTPPELAALLVGRLGRVGDRWARVLEPTCGRGNFLRAVLESERPPREAIGVELQSAYCDEARRTLGPWATIRNADVFEEDLTALPWRGDGPILVIGNPPWITNAELGRLSSGNRPERRNRGRLAGLDAMTGASNFDLAEAVWVRLLDALGDGPATIALLCKASVAQGVLGRLQRQGPSASAVWIEIDARRWFGAAVAAGFLIVTLGERSPRVPVYTSPETTSPSRSMGWIGDRFASDYEVATSLAFAIGASPVDWRQGIKHDAAAVMELKADAGGRLRNGLDELVDVEPEHLYPLAKGVDLAARGTGGGRFLIVTHRTLGEETRSLEFAAPRLWAYLNAHADRFKARRSSIYRGRPPFCLFGVGPYTFSPYKTAVAGIHRPTRFRAVGPVGGRPVVLDDTCYLVPCRTPEEAAVLAALGEDAVVASLLRALAPPGSKRPITKARLQAINLTAVLKRSDHPALLARAATAMRDELGLEGEVESAVAAEVERLAALG